MILQSLKILKLQFFIFWVQIHKNRENVDISTYSRFFDGGECGSRTHHQSFADSCLTAWLTRHILYYMKQIKKCQNYIGAGNGAQTRDLRLGKAALYQLSYSRINSVFIISKYIIKVNTSLIIFFYIFLFFYVTFIYVLC